MTCDDYRAHEVMAAGDAAAASAHLAGCPACRAWRARFLEGVTLADGALPPVWPAAVGARSAAGACDRARTLIASAPDDPPPAVDATLLQGHLRSCGSCRAFEAEWARVGAALPALATLDPGPAFTAAVLAATSRRPPRAAWAAWVAAGWRALVSRPRFAWEVAYVCTLCWLLVFGNPVRAFDWTTARLGAVTEAAGSRAAAVTALRSSVERESWWSAAGDVTRVLEQLPDAGDVKRAAAGGVQRAQAWAMAQVAGLLDVWRAWWRDVLSWFDGEPPAAPVR